MNETDSLNIAEVGYVFVSVREPRIKMFGKFVFHVGIIIIT